MERRVLQCCADNPDCPIEAECVKEYDDCVKSTDQTCKKDYPSYKKDKERRTKNYHRLVNAGVLPQVACRNMSDVRTRELLEEIKVT